MAQYTHVIIMDVTDLCSGERRVENVTIKSLIGKEEEKSTPVPKAHLRQEIENRWQKE